MKTEPTNLELIDSVVYLGSLVSDVRAVDPLLDVFRGVTATMPPSGELTPEQKSKLRMVKSQLRSYLLTREKVRVFTPESLQAQLEQRLSGRKTRYAAKLLVGVFALIIIITLVVSRLEPTSNRILYMELTGTTFYAMVHVGAALLFLSALKAFTTELRAAFKWVCLSVFILGVSLTLQPLFELLGLSRVVRPYAEILPVLVSASTMYVGARLYASPFAASSRLMDTWVVGLTIAGVGLGSTFLPHHAQILGGSEFGYRFVLGVQVAISLLATTSASLLGAASRKMSELYRRPTRSMQFAVGLSALVSLFSFVHQILTGNILFSGPEAIAIIVIVSIMGFSFLYSGYVLNEASRY